MFHVVKLNRPRNRSNEFRAKRIDRARQNGFTAAMKSFMPLTLVLVGLLAAGCIFGHKKSTETSAPVAPTSLVTPASSLTAKVVSYNSVGRFVVLSFPIGQMPQINQTLFLYRGGLKVAELKVTGPQSENNIVADLISGDAQVSDEVRDQ